MSIPAHHFEMASKPRPKRVSAAAPVSVSDHQAAAYYASSAASPVPDMGTVFLRAIGHFVFKTAFPTKKKMGQVPSGPKADLESRSRTASRTELFNEAAKKLYTELNNRQAKCPLSNQKFLPSNTLDEIITVDSVRASAGAAVRRETIFGSSDLAGDVVLKAKRIFAILVLSGSHGTIGDLLSEGLTDAHLPLSRKEDEMDMALVGVDGTEFDVFRDWGPPSVASFVEKQWVVQAPVLDSSGGHFVLGPGCGMPLETDVERIGATDLSEVYKCAFRPGYYKPASHVSCVTLAQPQTGT